MTITARNIAWLGRIGLSTRQHLGLALMETSILLAWTVLLDSILRFVTSMFLNALPLTFLVSANILALLESPRYTRMADPLRAFGLAEVDSHGRVPSGWRTLLRVLLTPVSFMLLLAGFIPVFFGRRSLPEAAAGVELVFLDPSHDPRPLDTILDERRRNNRNVLIYTFLSLAMAAVILFVPLGSVHITQTGRVQPDLGISAEDTELLTMYLEMKQRFPDSIEYHVRLASLYYRNDMDDDLAAELREIARLDPDHPMLLLAEDYGVYVPGLIEEAGGFPAVEDTGFGPGSLEMPQSPDSTSDSTSTGPVPAAETPHAEQPAPEPDSTPPAGPEPSGEAPQAGSDASTGSGQGAPAPGEV